MKDILSQNIMLEERKHYISKRKSLNNKPLPKVTDEGGLFYELDLEKGNNDDDNIFNTEKEVVVKDIMPTTASTSYRQSPN